MKYRRPKSLIRENLRKAKQAVLAAVEAYNKPGSRFRTGQFIVLIIIAWTALFHAIFYKRKIKPWYRDKKAGGKIPRYIYVDGDPKHWELSECLRNYYGSDNPPERENLRFLIGLRNKIEHRHLPELDPSLYGQCQAALLNFEELITKEFGEKHSLSDTLAISLQFTSVLPEQREKALKRLASQSLKSIRDYIDTFHASLPSAVLQSPKYRFSVFLVPKIANRLSSADFAVEFVPYDPNKPEEMENLEKIVALIKERQVPVANLNLLRPKQVVEEIKKLIPFLFSVTDHTRAWQFFRVRPRRGEGRPEQTQSKYCVYDSAHNDYLYTRQWVEFLATELADPQRYREILRKDPGTHSTPIAPTSNAGD